MDRCRLSSAALTTTVTTTTTTVATRSRPSDTFQPVVTAHPAWATVDYGSVGSSEARLAEAHVEMRLLSSPPLRLRQGRPILGKVSVQVLLSVSRLHLKQSPDEFGVGARKLHERPA